MFARLNAALEGDVAGGIMEAIGDMARAKGMRRAAQDTGLGR